MENQILLGFYGDDFTGSTDAMEALTLGGFRTVLFLTPPSSTLLKDSFPGIQAFGIAGVSRSLNPEQMVGELLPAFQALRDSGASICHYKTCSTFDSSPQIGNIGKAIELGSEVIHPTQSFVPLLVGVPALKRYTIFGNHFATVAGVTYRLDRHPIMLKHPMTPMDEADLLKHLGKQTDKKMTLVNILELANDISVVKEIVVEKKQHSEIILFDVLDDNSLRKAGEILLDEAKNGQLFTVGSSGVEYALSAAIGQKQEMETENPSFPSIGSSQPMLVVSGSCSAVTKGQIEYAMGHGFTGIKISGEEFLDGDQVQLRASIVEQVTKPLDKGENVVLYSALGPDDPSIERVKRRLVESGRSTTDTGQFLGEELGKITKRVIESSDVNRLVVAGGDTSGYVIKELEIYAMEVVMPITPGGPLCKTYSDHKRFDGLELCLKGGQIGSPDLFLKVKNGQ